MSFRLFRGWLGHFLGWSILMMLGLAITAWWGWSCWTGPGPAQPSDEGATLVTIPQGMTLSAAADTLVVRGLLDNRQYLLLGARLSGQGRGLRTGLYRLEYGSSPRDLLANLTSGRSVQIKVTIPEGLSATEIAGIVGGRLGFSEAQFLAAADSVIRQAWADHPLFGDGSRIAGYDSLLSLPGEPGVRQYYPSEGYLAPDTYLFGTGTGPGAVAGHLIQTQLERLAEAWASKEGQRSLLGSPHDLLVLASIVEAEARREDERTRIAAVYSNRLAKGRRLEADPTVAFILDKKGKRLFYKDLEVDSPFNTYRNKGLPPGPIGAPGLLALMAAARPDTSCRAMYFVSDGQGGHVFSRTAEEHQAAVREFRRLKAAERRNQ